VAAAVVMLFAFGTAVARHEPTRADDVGASQLTIRDLLQVKIVGAPYDPSQVQISPDGKWVAYQVRETLLDENKYRYDLWLVSTAEIGQPRKLATSDATAAERAFMNPRWSPDSASIAYSPLKTNAGQLRLIRHDTFEDRELIRNGAMTAGYDPNRQGGHVTGFEWSPDGHFIAFTRGVATGTALAGRSADGPFEADVDWRPGAERATPTASVLCVLDARTQHTIQLTDPSLNVQAFDWSPDSSRFVIAASTSTSYTSYMDADLFLVDRASHRVTPLLQQPGMERDPVWSPDGRWIAFGSQRGTEDWLQQTTLAVIPASGGRPMYPTAQFMEDAAYCRDRPHWSADSRYLYFLSPYHLANQLFVVPATGGRPRKITPAEDHTYSQFTYASHDGPIAFVGQSVVNAPEVYVTTLHPFVPRRVTHVNARMESFARASAELMSWRSADDKWDIHGVLVKPPDFDHTRRYPLLVFIQGGPGMVQQRYDLGTQYPLQVLAGRGYVVFAPNTRGREGYGDKFMRAIGDEQSYGRLPLQDILTGVDELVSRNIADPDRLGLLGFSYGGYLTAFAITQTHRFKAASVNEGIVDIPYNAFLQAGSEHRRSLLRIMSGFDPPYEPSSLHAMMDQSALYHLDAVTTPVLLEYGLNSEAGDQGRLFFNGLARFNVPAEFIVYPRTGHGIEEPLLKQASMERNIAWFDYWMRGEPYPDPAKRRKYDAWRRAAGQ
jgi:dipeptidyl aminopeptidase/acylaminoacyl peptidase